MRRPGPVDASRQGHIVEWSAVDDYGGPVQEAKQAWQCEAFQGLGEQDLLLRVVVAVDLRPCEEVPS
jgi:hypothetical protein